MTHVPAGISKETPPKHTLLHSCPVSPVYQPLYVSRHLEQARRQAKVSRCSNGEISRFSIETFTNCLGIEIVSCFLFFIEILPTVWVIMTNKYRQLTDGFCRLKLQKLCFLASLRAYFSLISHFFPRPSRTRDTHSHDRCPLITRLRSPYDCRGNGKFKEFNWNGVRGEASRNRLLLRRSCYR